MKGRSGKRKALICKNHLSDFYEAVKAGNLVVMDKIEHELTESEKCVACAYVFKTKGTVRESLEDFLSGEGMDVDEAGQHVKRGELFYWGSKILVFLVVCFVVIFGAVFIKETVFHKNPSFSIIELTIIGLVALIAFLFVDDRFLD